MLVAAAAEAVAEATAARIITRLLGKLTQPDSRKCSAVRESTGLQSGPAKMDNLDRNDARCVVTWLAALRHFGQQISLWIAPASLALGPFGDAFAIAPKVRCRYQTRRTIDPETHVPSGERAWLSG